MMLLPRAFGPIRVIALPSSLGISNNRFLLVIPSKEGIHFGLA